MARVVWDSRGGIPGRTISGRRQCSGALRCAGALTREHTGLKGRIRRAACVHSHRSGILKSISDDQKNQPTFDQPTTRLPCPRCCGSLLLPPRGARLFYRRPTFERFLPPNRNTPPCISFLLNGYILSSFFGRPPTANTTERESPIYFKSLGQLFPRLHRGLQQVTYVSK